MSANLHLTFSNSLCRMMIAVFWSWIHSNVFAMASINNSPASVQMRHYINKWWHISLTHIWGNRLCRSNTYRFRFVFYGTCRITAANIFIQIAKYLSLLYTNIYSQFSIDIVHIRKRRETSRSCGDNILWYGSDGCSFLSVNVISNNAVNKTRCVDIRIYLFTCELVNVINT